MPHASLDDAALFDAVVSVVTDRGFDELTLSDVASESGVDIRTLARSFPTKQALARGAFARVFARVSDELTGAIGERYGADAIRVFILTMLPDTERKVTAARLLLPFWQLALHDDELAAASSSASDAWRTLLRTWMREGMADGDIRADVPVDAVTEMVLNWVAGTQSAAIGEARFNSPDQLRSQVDALLNLLRG
ncbi:hypothetical protein GCM10027591_11250 [Zhihengliuella somnathii]